ncbi:MULTISPECIES: efflux RND transporter periplasmic adaptor subunit [unclassified Bradyrhizobium]|uniref:efflux RND transporter periplasmic adaptor subunit n=1 Tax=unclassified Bradyrhizobium TaxID=2631580 RepID=UPI002FF12D7E
MFRKFRRISRAIAFAVVATCATPTAAPAHEGHDHADEPPASVSAAPRGEAASAEFELVAVARGDAIDIYVDRFATNEPVTGASLVVETPAGPATPSEQPDGAYRLAAPWLAKGGRTDLVVSISARDLTDILPVSIETPPQTSASRVAQAGSSADLRTALHVGGGFVAGLLVAAVALRRRRAAIVALACMALAGGVEQGRAHEGHGHEEEKGQVAIKTNSEERAQRLSDGTVFVPKSVQRIFALRSLVTEKARHPKVAELPGRIIPDPAASGYVQSSVGGRLSASTGGFPRLGTRVKQGDILGYVTPPLQAIDLSDMRQRQGELDQQISIVERRVARYEQLAAGGAVSRTQLEEARLELEGLRDRRASIEKARREPEALVAPVAGVIAEGTAVAGQIVQPSSIVFNIVDPSRLWVEALSFETIEGATSARATTYSGRSLDLEYRGAGFADRSQSVPVHFSIVGDTAGLRAGQFLTVLVPTREEKEGIAVPRNSLVRGSNGQDFVYEHVGPERFAPRSVRAEPLDGENVLIMSGVAAGKRIVSQGAELLEHVR